MPPTPTLMQINRVPVADIVTEGRLRPVSEAGVESLIASITETGVMKDAIHVRKKRAGGLHLIAGGHRLEAARRMGWEVIEAKVWADVTDDWARLMEIDDNLAGAEMNALDTAVFLAERKAVYERLHPETRRGGDRKSPAFRDQTDMMSVRSFAAATSEKFGLTERHVRRMIAVGAALEPGQVAQLRGAPRPVKLVDLAELAKIGDADERAQVILRLSSGNAKSASDARRSLRAENGLQAPVKSTADEQYQALLRAWERAGAVARRRFGEDKYPELFALVASLEGASGDDDTDDREAM